jgi:ribosomal protein L32
MGLFDKKFCDICGNKIKMLGNKKLEDGNMCKDCAAQLSPFTTDRRKTTLAEIKDHLAYREANKEEVAKFNVTRTLGDKTKVLLDEDNNKFIVTSSSRWQNDNPDVMAFSQVTGCQTEIRESRKEIKRKDKDGREVSFNPPRYDIDYDFYITIHINSPFFNEIEFKLNNNRIDKRDSVEFKEFERQAREIKTALTKVRQDARNSIAAANAPKIAQTCPHCGATTMPNASGQCEFCGGAMG